MGVQLCEIKADDDFSGIEIEAPDYDAEYICILDKDDPTSRIYLTRKQLQELSAAIDVILDS